MGWSLLHFPRGTLENINPGLTNMIIEYKYNRLIDLKMLVLEIIEIDKLI